MYIPPMLDHSAAIDETEYMVTWEEFKNGNLTQTPDVIMFPDQETFDSISAKSSANEQYVTSHIDRYVSSRMITIALIETDGDPVKAVEWHNKMSTEFYQEIWDDQVAVYDAKNHTEP